MKYLITLIFGFICLTNIEAMQEKNSNSKNIVELPVIPEEEETDKITYPINPDEFNYSLFSQIDWSRVSQETAEKLQWIHFCMCPFGD